MISLGNCVSKSLDEVFFKVKDYYESFYFSESFIITEKYNRIIASSYEKIKKDFYDLNIESLFSLSNEITKLIRTVFGVYGEYDLEQLVEENGKNGLNKIRTSILRFENGFKRSIDFEIKLYIFLGDALYFKLDDDKKKLLKSFLEVNYKFLEEKGYKTIDELTVLTQKDLIDYWGRVAVTPNKLIDIVHLLGYKFRDEIKFDTGGDQLVYKK